jgi:hypothetical protein
VAPLIALSRLEAFFVRSQGWGQPAFGAIGKVVLYYFDVFCGRADLDFIIFLRG